MATPWFAARSFLLPSSDSFTWTLWPSGVTLGSRDKSTLQLRYSFYLAVQQACIHVCLTCILAFFTARGFPDVWEILSEQAPLGVPVEAVLGEHLLPGELLVSIKAVLSWGPCPKHHPQHSTVFVVYSVCHCVKAAQKWQLEFLVHKEFKADPSILYTFMKSLSLYELQDILTWNFLKSSNHVTHAVRITMDC